MTKHARLAFTLLTFLTLFLVSVRPTKAQQVSLSTVEVKTNNEGFIISGKVYSSNLNPKGQIVESDHLSVVAEIPLGDNYSFPLLWEAMVIRSPADVETPYKKDGEFLSKKELNGENIKKIKLLGSTPIRDVTVWRKYGGLKEWRNNAPESVDTEFEGVVPAEYAGSQIRVRATLNHTYGGPNAAWSAYTFAHDTTDLTLIEFANDANSNGPAHDQTGQKPSAKTGGQGGSQNGVGNNNQVSEKVKTIFNAAISVFKKKKKQEQTSDAASGSDPAQGADSTQDSGQTQGSNPNQPTDQTQTSQQNPNKMTSFPEPDTDKANSFNHNPEQQAAIKKLIDQLAQDKQVAVNSTSLGKIIQDLNLAADIQLADNTNPSSAPDDTFQTKYWLNKTFVDPFIDKVSSYVPIGQYYKDYVKSAKDSQVFSNNEDKIKKTALDYNVDKTSANYFNKYNKITSIEKKYSPMKNAVPATTATKPFSWLLDKIGWGAKKQYAQSLGKEYKYIRQEIKTYTNKTGMSRQEAIQRVKDDYVGFQGDYGNGSFGKIDTGIKWWGSKGKYQETEARFDDMVQDMIKNEEI
jgi:hypothetical protein